MTKTIEKASAAELKEALKVATAAEKKEADRLRKEYERDRDALVKSTVRRIDEGGALLKSIKTDSIDQLLALQKQSFTALGRKPREEMPDSFTVTSEDGKSKLSLERKYKGVLDETSHVAIDSIKGILKDTFEPRSKRAYKVMDTLLKKNAQGDYDERSLAKLRKIEEEMAHPGFSEAMDILARSYRPTSSQLYVRAYQLNERGRWDQVDIQFSKM